jgi:hypothetical protein
VLNHWDLPLIIAATEGIDASYRTVNTYPHLVETRWPGNPEELSDAELAANVRTILDEVHAAELVDLAGMAMALLAPVVIFAVISQLILWYAEAHR